jgi:hypothetical protein
MRKILALAAISMMAATPVYSDDWIVHNLIRADDLLDGICRGTTDPDSSDAKLACKARQVVYEAIDKHNWCYGKIGQVALICAGTNAGKILSAHRRRIFMHMTTNNY